MTISKAQQLLDILRRVEVDGVVFTDGMIGPPTSTR